MFSQSRNAAENLAPKPRKTSENEEEVRGSDSPSTPYQSKMPGSADYSQKAFSSSRNSSNTQRSSSPVPHSARLGSESRLQRSSIEERLRAKLASRGMSHNTSVNSDAPAQGSLPDPSPRSQSCPPPAPIPQAADPSPGSENPDPTSSNHAFVMPSQMSPVEAGSSTDPLQTNTIIDSKISNPVPPSPHLSVESANPDSVGEDPLPASRPSSNTGSVDASMGDLRDRLNATEKQFSELSVSHQQLQADVQAADVIIREFSPTGTIRNVDLLRDFLSNLTMKLESSQDEIKRLSGKLTRQEERIEEIRDTHRLESKSQSARIESLGRQLTETENILTATQNSISQAEGDSAKGLAEIEQLKTEIQRAQNLAKEEEEKRVKAISLLKTVRQKLVKAEKEKDEAVKEWNLLKEKETGFQEREKAEISRLQQEVHTINAEREKAVLGLKAQFDKELANLKEKHSKEMSAVRMRLEMENSSSEEAHSRELAAKDMQISTLESTVNAQVSDKNSLFSQLQLRQADLEFSQSQLDSVQSQKTELQYQLRESQGRIQLLNEELVEARRDYADKPLDATTLAARSLFVVEAKYESRLADLEQKLSVMERERNDAEAEWSRKLREKAREMEDLKRTLELFSTTRKESESNDANLQAEIQQLQEELQRYQDRLAALQRQNTPIEDAPEDKSLGLGEKLASLERQIDEGNVREAQLRMQNKVLRDELRKVQSAAVAVLERQRNPGVSYWTDSHVRNSANPTSSKTPDSPSRTSSPGPDLDSRLDDDDINIEYLRNVILQFLEHKEMRPSLVRVLSTILRFTPQETRRLIARV